MHMKADVRVRFRPDRIFFLAVGRVSSFLLPGPVQGPKKTRCRSVPRQKIHNVIRRIQNRNLLTNALLLSYHAIVLPWQVLLKFDPKQKELQFLDSTTNSNALGVLVMLTSTLPTEGGSPGLTGRNVNWCRRQVVNRRT